MNRTKGAFWRLFLCLAYLLPSATQAEPACPGGQLDEIATVKYVHDGDTVHLQDGRKIRLIGINTPELARDGIPEQPYASEAREALLKAISRHDNRVGLVHGAERHDRYGRTLAHLFSPDGENLQAVLLLQGMAVAVTHPPNTRYSECYAGQEKAARCQGAGIWSNPEQTIIAADRLDGDSTGFQLITGRIDHVSQSGKGMWLYMAGLKIGVLEQNLTEFKREELLDLAGRHVTVRGWLHPVRRKQANRESSHGRTVNIYMRLRHPSDLEINSEGKC